MMGYYGRGPYGYEGYNHMLGGGPGGLGMLLFGALVLLGIILLVVWAAKASHMHRAAHAYATAVPAAPLAPVARADEATLIARRRLASGEITPEQYTEIVTALGG
jgi:uncharacterized membrane protein